MLTKFEELNQYDIESDSLREYADFKNENPDDIILFQIGTFYETLFEDAKIFSETTGTALGVRNFKKGIQIIESGVPVSNLKTYLKMLLNNGLRVCICAQFCDEFGKYYRELTRKYTPGTISEDEFLEACENNYLASVFLKDDIYYFAYADVSTGQIYKTTLNLKQLRCEISKISPNEMLIPSSQKYLFENLISKCSTTILDDIYFDSNIEKSIDKYCKLTQKNYKSKLDKVIEYSPASYMTLDEMTRKNLELTRTNYLMKKKGSVLWFLNYTLTPMGARLLRKFLDEPLLNENEINQRLDAVDELYKNPNMLDRLRKILEQFSDILRFCNKISDVSILPKDLINLSRNTLLLNDLKNETEKLKSNFFKINPNNFEKLLKLSDAINGAVKKNCFNDLKSGNIIEDGYNSELDFLRSELKKIKAEIEKYAISQSKELSIKTLSVKYSPVIGYYIEIPSKYAINLPFGYYKKNSNSKVSRYTTDELTNYENDIQALQYKVNNLEYDLFKKLRILTANFISTIRKLAHEIAFIDVIASFAKCALENNLVRPCFSKNEIKIKEGYHPSLIKLNNEIIKNDTALIEGSMMILTGANMSGKSTYLKTNAIICLLSQIGSYIPAQFANIPIIDRIIFRQGAPDDIINNNSSFMVEMNDLKYITDNISDSSFILLDEPAKSTNLDESTAITKAFCEYILSNYKTKTIIATHNLGLTNLESKYPNRVQNFVMGLNNLNTEIIDRKIRKGVADNSKAINVALLAELPNEIIDLAKEYMNN